MFSVIALEMLLIRVEQYNWHSMYKQCPTECSAQGPVCTHQAKYSCLYYNHCSCTFDRPSNKSTVTGYLFLYNLERVDCGKELLGIKIIAAIFIWYDTCTNPIQMSAKICSITMFEVYIFTV